MTRDPHRRITARAIPVPDADELAETIDEAEEPDPIRASQARIRARTPISVPRAETPDDDVLARAVAALRALGVNEVQTLTFGAAATGGRVSRGRKR